MATAQRPLMCPVAELRPGMTVWTDKGNVWERDTFLADWLYSGVDMTGVPRGLQFESGVRGSGHYVMWHSADISVPVTLGNDKRKEIRK